MSKPVSSLSETLETVREPRETLNYYAIIMNGLEDIRRVRSSFTTSLHVNDLAMLFERYYNSVHALYNILLEEYRGLAKTYLRIAVKAFLLWYRFVRGSISGGGSVDEERRGDDGRRGHPPIRPRNRVEAFLAELGKEYSVDDSGGRLHDASNPHDPEEFIELLKQYLGEEEKILVVEELGEPKNFINSFYVVLSFLDKAVMEIINALNKSNVLRRGKDILLGVVK